MIVLVKHDSQNLAPTSAPAHRDQEKLIKCRCYILPVKTEIYRRNALILFLPCNNRNLINNRIFLSSIASPRKNLVRNEYIYYFLNRVQSQH